MKRTRFLFSHFIIKIIRQA